MTESVRARALMTRGLGVLLVVVLPLSLLAHLAERRAGDGAERTRWVALGRTYAALVGLEARVRLGPFSGQSGAAEYFVTRGAGAAARGCLAVVSGPGYRDTIELAVAFRGGEIAGVAVLEHQESTGFGARVLEDARWLGQFVGIPTDAGGAVIASTREGGRIDAISGATITSEAVTHLVLNATTRAVACTAAAD